MSFGPYLCWGLVLNPRQPAQVACGLKLGSAAILNQNPIFEMGAKLPNENNLRFAQK
jgi:hypothetical protein